MMKRLFDIVISSLLLILLSPVLLVLSILVRITLGSPVLFRQVRPGLNGKPFMMYKFRTMTDERDEHGRLLPDEQRLTKVGRFLRSTSLDELPELFNVLKGDMSLVGPRPLLMEYLPLYTPEQARRHEVRPGITGWAQVNGRCQGRNEMGSPAFLVQSGCGLEESSREPRTPLRSLRVGLLGMWGFLRGIGLVIRR